MRLKNIVSFPFMVAIIFLFTLPTFTEEKVSFHQENEWDLVNKYNTEITNNSQIFTTYIGNSNLSQSLSHMKRVHISYNENEWDIENTPNSFVSLPSQITDWGIKAIGAPLSWESRFTGKGVRIAIVDTGIDIDHEDLRVAGGVAISSSMTSFDDENGHGTHIAGIIGGLNNEVGIVGVAPDAELYAVRALDRYGAGYISDIIAGINWAIAHEMDIINLSIGTPLSYSALYNVIQKANNKGILVVASAGNDGGQENRFNTINAPALYDEVIAVSAVNKSIEIADFSSTGSEIEIAAPGEKIISTFPGNHYLAMDGTSMATPFVTGTLALLKEAYPKASAEELRSILRALVSDMGAEGKDIRFGYGFLQTPNVVDATFTDMKGHWATSSVIHLMEKGLVNGYPDKTFRPSNSITRSEFAKLIVQALDLPLDSEATLPFADHKKIPLWAQPFVTTAVTHGIILGKKNIDGSLVFDSQAEITRVEMAVMIERTLKNKQKTAPISLSFTDTNTIPSWGLKSVNITAGLNLIGGFEDGTFRAKEELTRAQASTILSRLIPMLGVEGN